MISVEPELFSLDLSFDDYIGNTIYQYKPQTDTSTTELFGNDVEVTLFSLKKINGIYNNSENGPTIITTSPLSDSDSKIELTNGKVINLMKISDRKITENDKKIIFRLINNDIYLSIVEAGFVIRGKTAFNSNEPLKIEIKSSNEATSNLAKHITVYPGFHYRLREYNKELLLQITPKTTIEFNTDIHTLISEKIFSNSILETLCKRVRLRSNRIAYLHSILSSKGNQSLDISPYNGKNYVEYVNGLGFDTLENPDANLLLVQEKGKPSCTFTSSEKTKPIIDFSLLAQIDSDLHSSITHKSKTQSAKRKDLALEYASKITIKTANKEIRIGARKSYSGNFNDPPPFTEKFAINQFFKFPDPWVSFRDKEGAIVHASKQTGDLGAPQDLLPGKYIPFLSPPEIKLTVLAVKGFEDQAELLKKALDSKSTLKILDIQDTLNCKFIIDDIISIDPENIDNTQKIESDCCLVVGPKYYLDSAGNTSDAYVNIESWLLEHGIPCQYVIHDSGGNPKFDKSIESKISNRYIFFGIGLSILSKVGGCSLVLSQTTTKEFPDHSVVIGYNIARVYEKPNLKLQQETPDSLQLTKTSIPISACVSMMDQTAGIILHQLPHLIPDEVSLFHGERGKKIFELIPPDCNNIIIHKDGAFSDTELSDLQKLKKPGVNLIPISIVTTGVPRLTTTVQPFYLPKAGMCLPLSENDFLLSTTLVSGTYDPNAKGWPNPLLITIHKLQNQPNIPPQLKIRIISQIWALTRCHPASQFPIKKPLSIHYSNKIATFITKAGNTEPGYLKLINKKNRLNLYPKPFI